MKIIKKSAAPEHDGSNSSGTIAPGTTNVVEFPISKSLGEIASNQPDIEKNEQKNKKGKITKPSKALKRGRPRTHGLSGTRTYRSWASAKNRCTNPNFAQYSDYGGRGIECRITVEELVEEIGERPEGKTLDRIDKNGHYEPGNIQWATPKQQAKNRRSPRHYREQAKARLRAGHRDWVDNAQLWNLSIKSVNQGGRLADVEREELDRLANGLNVPRASFDRGDYFDHASAIFDTFYDDQRGASMRWVDRHFRSDMFVRFDWTFREIGDAAGKTVLDIGCGSAGATQLTVTLRFATSWARAFDMPIRPAFEAA